MYLAGCLPYQKNGVVVRQVVGHGRLTGEHACRQLAEVYRALRLYVNCFQPSMKLVAKQVVGRKIHRTYDVAKTPLQRLLLSGALSASRQQELLAVARALDPVRLFHQMEQLQQALFLCEGSDSSAGHRPPVPVLVAFELDGITTERFQRQARGQDEGGILSHDQQDLSESTHVLDWRHTRNDPFVGQWEQILAFVQADPTRSSGDIFRELQAQFPGRYQPGHLRTLQRCQGRSTGEPVYNWPTQLKALQNDKKDSPGIKTPEQREPTMIRRRFVLSRVSSRQWEVSQVLMLALLSPVPG